MNFSILTVPKNDHDTGMICYSNYEADAEEVAAALALAGFHAQVWASTKLLHEFFPTE